MPAPADVDDAAGVVALPRLLLFTDAAVCAGRGRGVVASVAKAFAGIDVDGRVAVIARGVAVDVVSALVPVCRRASALVFAHDDASLVAALDLDGVHLKAATPARAARLRLPPGRLLGRSLHADDTAANTAANDPDDRFDDDVSDYATLSPIFGARSKPADRRPALGVQALRDRKRPTYALGAVDVVSARGCVDNGAAGVAVISAVFGAVDPRRALLDLLEVMA